MSWDLFKYKLYFSYNLFSYFSLIRLATLATFSREKALKPFRQATLATFPFRDGFKTAVFRLPWKGSCHAVTEGFAFPQGKALKISQMDLQKMQWNCILPKVLLNFFQKIFKVWGETTRSFNSINKSFGFSLSKANRVWDRVSRF